MPATSGKSQKGFIQQLAFKVSEFISGSNEYVVPSLFSLLEVVNFLVSEDVVILPINQHSSMQNEFSRRVKPISIGTICSNWVCIFEIPSLLFETHHLSGYKFYFRKGNRYQRQDTSRWIVIEHVYMNKHCRWEYVVVNTGFHVKLWSVWFNKR
jgi:hypothetical protein